MTFRIPFASLSWCASSCGMIPACANTSNDSLSFSGKRRLLSLITSSAKSAAASVIFSIYRSQAAFALRSDRYSSNDCGLIAASSRRYLRISAAFSLMRLLIQHLPCLFNILLDAAGKDIIHPDVHPLLNICHHTKPEPRCFLRGDGSEFNSKVNVRLQVPLPGNGGTEQEDAPDARGKSTC